jgi:hypothetical protein
MNGCKGKVRHPTRDMADEHIEGLKADGKAGHPKGPPMMPYRCRFCGTWHVGHYRTSEKRKAYNTKAGGMNSGPSTRA